MTVETPPQNGRQDTHYVGADARHTSPLRLSRMTLVAHFALAHVPRERGGPDGCSLSGAACFVCGPNFCNCWIRAPGLRACAISAYGAAAALHSVATVMKGRCLASRACGSRKSRRCPESDLTDIRMLSLLWDVFSSSVVHGKRA